MHLHLSDIARVINAEVAASDPIITGAKINSQLIDCGDLFIAIEGEHVDGHAYLAQAREAGAAAALVSKRQDDELPQLVVDNVVKAFGEFTAYWSKQCDVKLIAITGSNGKTTVKEMVAAILRQTGKVLSTRDNLNNKLGVPLTLARLDKDDDYAVVEMGASKHGDIALLVDIAKPDVSLINNIAPAHLEGFGSIEGVAEAKGEIFAGLSSGGVAIVNMDMPYQAIWQQALTNKKIIGFAINSNSDITAEDIQLDPDSSYFMVELNDEFHYINLPVPGLHNVANALAAIAITHALDIAPNSIIKGLAAMRGVPHRFQIRVGINGSQLVDDTYNANPASYHQALATLNGLSGQHWLVLGDFGELGEKSEDLHRQMGLDARSAGIDKLFAIGQQSHLAADAFGDDAQTFEDIIVLEKLLNKQLNADVTCLIKGSRFMQLDKLADALATTEED